jgi:hypothetical protein
MLGVSRKKIVDRLHRQPNRQAKTGFGQGFMAFAILHKNAAMAWQVSMGQHGGRTD